MLDFLTGLLIGTDIAVHQPSLFREVRQLGVVKRGYAFFEGALFPMIVAALKPSQNIKRRTQACEIWSERVLGALKTAFFLFFATAIFCINSPYSLDV